MEGPSRRALLACLFFASLLLRLATAAGLGFGSTKFGDAEAYVHTAEMLLETGRYPDNAESLPVFRAPGYPIFLAVSTFGHPRSAAGGVLGNVVLGAVAVLLAARLAERVVGGWRAGAVAGILAAIDPSLVLLSTDVQSECLTIVLLLLFAQRLLAAGTGGRSRDALYAGLLLGAAALVRPSCLALAPLLLAVPAVGGTLRLRAASCALGGLALAVAPWTVRNFSRYGVPLPVNDQGGVVFWLGNTQLNADYYALRTPGEYAAYLEKFSEEVDRGTVRRIAQQHANPALRSRAFFEDARAWIRAHPAAWTRLLANKALDWLRPWASPLAWSPRIVIATAVWNVVLFALAAVGLACAPRRAAWAAAGWLVLSAGVHVAMIVVLRYRATFWDPVLIVLAALAVTRLEERWYSRS